MPSSMRRAATTSCGVAGPNPVREPGRHFLHRHDEIAVGQPGDRFEVRVVVLHRELIRAGCRVLLQDLYDRFGCHVAKEDEIA